MPEIPVSPPLRLKLGSMFKRFRTQEPHISHGSSQQHTLPIQTSPLCKIPVEILYDIFSLLADNRPYDEIQRDLLHLSATCKLLRSVLPVELLYNGVQLSTKHKALKFLKMISASKTDPSLKWFTNSVVHITFVHPSQDFVVNGELLGFSGSMSNQLDVERSWAEIILDILSRLPNVRSIDLKDISPKFEFPLNIATTKLGQSLIKSKLPNLQTIYLSSERGWNVTLRQSLLWPFGSYTALHLHNMVVDMSLGGKTGLLATQVTLSACLVLPQQSEYMFPTYFRRITTLNIDYQTLSVGKWGGLLFPRLEVLNLGWTGCDALITKTPSFESKLYIAQLSPFVRGPFPAVDLLVRHVIDASLKLNPRTICACVSSHKDMSQWLTSTNLFKEHPSLQNLILVVTSSLDIDRWSKFDFSSVPVPLQVVNLNNRQVIFTNTN